LDNQQSFPNSNSQEQQSNKSELWNLSLRDLFYKYVRFLPLFVLSTAFALLISYVYLRYTTPLYNVGGTLLIKQQQGSGKSDKFEDILGNNKTQNIQSEMEILKSTPLMERVVDSLHLQLSYSAVGKIRRSVNIYRQGPFLVDTFVINNADAPFQMKIKFVNGQQFRVNDDEALFRFGQMFKNQFGIFRLKKNFGFPSGEYTVDWKPTRSVARSFAGALTITPKTQGTGILNISMVTTNSQQGADILNELMKDYDYYSVETNQKSSDQILDFIDNRLNYYSAIRDSIQQVLLRYQQDNNLISVETQSGAYFGVIGETDKFINEQMLNLSMAQSLQEYLSDKKNEFNKMVVPSSLGLEDPTLNALVAEYNKLVLDRQDLVNGNVPVNNPVVVELSGRIEKVRASILENLKNIKAAMNTGIAQSKSQSSVSQTQLRSMPAKEKREFEIKQQLETYMGLIKILQEKREETAISKASTISNSGIIEPATPTTVPMKPNKKSIRILAILLGIGLPAILIFVGEILNDKVSTRFDIEKITSVPILGEIGHSYSENILVVNKTTRSMVAEQFRIIRSNLQYVLNQQKKSVILVTSSFSGEGKSYVSTNMGAVLALAGKKTLMLEFDIRKPKLIAGLGIQKGPGISNFLVGKSQLQDLVRQVPNHENLFVLGCGPIPPNPAELLLDPAVDELFRWAKENYDIVLIDTAPVGMVSDAMTLSKFADCTLYLVRQGHTFKKQVALIDEFYQDHKLPKISIIINDVKLKAGYGYYGYGRYGYGYGYGYGSYYEEETAPQGFFEKVFGFFDIRRLFGRNKKKRR
jgi:tyrosine-protein kinase Etk/Wzc